MHTTLQSKSAKISNTQRTTDTKKLETKYYRLYVSTYVKFKEAQTNPWSYKLKTNQPVYIWVRGGDWEGQVLAILRTFLDLGSSARKWQVHLVQVNQAFTYDVCLFNMYRVP